MNGIKEFVKNHDVVDRTNHEVYDEYASETKNPMTFVRFMRELSYIGYTTKPKCTAGGMSRVIIRKPLDDFDKGFQEYISERRDMFEGTTTLETYAHYVKLCDSEGYPKVSSIEFSRRMCREFGMITKQISIDGKRRYVFTYR